MSVPPEDADGHPAGERDEQADDSGPPSRRTMLRSIGALAALGAVDVERRTEPRDRPFALLRTPASVRLSDEGSGTGESAALTVERVPTPTAALSALVDGRAAAAELDPLAALLAERAGLGTVVLQASGGIADDRGDEWRVESVLATDREDVDALADLRGRTVVLGDPLCATDSLYPLATLRERTDDAAVRWVDSGRATGSAAAVGAAAETAREDGLGTVAEAGELPRPVIVSGASLSDVARERFVDAAFAAAGGEGWFGALRRVDAAALEDVAERAADVGVRLDAL